ncbi:hypothetical protein TYRP_013080 [Tyrophagus putrescentiae]|nr:hypothetical protein TYRP_013080 [Tyrophagus putrescentiae]
MLSSPRYTRSLFDSIDDDFHRSLEPSRSHLRRVFNSSLDDDFNTRHHNITTSYEQKPAIRDDKFTLSLDFHQFEPSDISVKVEDGDTLLVKAKREKKEGGMVESREFSQRYSLPKGVIGDRLTAKLDGAGYLQVEAPVKKEEPKEYRPSYCGSSYRYGGRTIPVQVVYRSPSYKF